MIIKELTAYDCADGYTIGEDGTVYHNGRKLTSHLDHNGYYQIRIYNKQHRRLSVLIHRLIAFTFLDTPNDLYMGGNNKSGYTVDHIDGNKINNHYTNLRWVSFYDNIKRQTDFDYMDDQKAMSIIQDLINLYSQQEIMEKYKPKYFIHGHVHRNYGRNIPRICNYKDTTVINACGYYEIEINEH